MIESAFPTTQYVNGISPTGHTEGMTLRDYFAAKAMQEFCKEFDDDAHIAKVAYKIADAMMEARK